MCGQLLRRSGDSLHLCTGYTAEWQSGVCGTTSEATSARRARTSDRLRERYGTMRRCGGVGAAADPVGAGARAQSQDNLTGLLWDPAG